MGEYYIHDFIEDYSGQDEKNIQLETSSRKEFYQLKSSNTNKEDYRFKFFKHQEMFKRYGIEYDRIFNIHETGTGKTGSIINLAEYYEKNKKIKRIYVLQPGPPTVDDFKEQIKKFKLKNVKKDITEDYLFKLNKEIKEFYEVTTYQKFVKDDLSDSYIEKYYSDCIFFFDEAHKLRNLSDGEGGSLTDTQINKIYDYLWRITHTVKRSKVVVATATPMINNVKDFVPLINLLLPSDRQFPDVKDEDFYNTLNIYQVEPYFRGLFTYVRFFQEDIHVTEKGEKMKNLVHEVFISKKKQKGDIEPEKKKIKDKKIVTIKSYKNKKVALESEKIKSSLVIYPLEMKNIQLTAYKDYKEKNNIESFYSNTSQISVFVYPNGMYGNKGFNLYIGENEFKKYFLKDNIIYKKESVTPLTSIINIKNIESSLNNLSKLSNKFHFFIKKELKNSENERPGNSFCYIDQVEGSGAIILSLILERFGFENFTSNNQGVIDPKNNRFVDTFKKKKRFSLITGKTPNLRNILRVFNNPDNLDGEYIQILIVSEVARDGINIKNVLRGYIMTPGWHESGMHQALSRFVRADSHDLLINRNIKENKDPKVNVDIYKLASVISKDNMTKEKNRTTDLKKYIDSELKDIKIKRVLRLMKICSYDAYLNYCRNFRKSDISFTKISDYSESLPRLLNVGDYKIKDKNGIVFGTGPGEEDIIFNTYNLLYLDQDKDFINNNLEDDIKGNVLYLESIKNKIEEVNNRKNSDYLYYYIVKKLTNYDKFLFSNDLNTDKLYYKRKGNILYQTAKTSFDKNKWNSITENYYSFTNLNDTDEIKLESYITNKVNDLYKKLEGKNKESIRDIYARDQNHIEFKFLLEDSLLRFKNKNMNQTNIIILELFYNYWMELKIPEGWLEVTNKKLGEVTEKKQGRKREEGSKAGLKDLNLSDYPKKDSKKTVYIHFYRESDKTGFNITSILEGKFRKIRILEGEEFRDTNFVEEFVYTKIFDDYYEELLKKFKKSKYYGSYILRGGNIGDPLYKRKKEFFRIIDTSNPRNKGRVCTNNNPETIQKVLKFLDTDKRYKKYYTQTNKKESICNIVENLFEEKGLLFKSM